MSEPYGLAAEFEFYLAYQDEMVRQYDGRVVAIKQARVIGVYDDIPAAIRGSEDLGHARGSFLVILVSPGEEGYTQTFHSRAFFS